MSDDVISDFSNFFNEDENVNVSTTTSSSYRQNVPRPPRKLPTQPPMYLPHIIEPHIHNLEELIRHETQNHLSPQQQNQYLINHINQMVMNHKKSVGISAPRFSEAFNTNEIETKFESAYMHKYGHLMESSYIHYNQGREAVDEYLLHPDKDYIPELKEFLVDENLSTKDDLVLHNPNTGETVISFRGTQTKEAAKDWFTNAKIAMGIDGGQNTSRYNNARIVTESAISKYGIDNVITTGHSQGGGVSSVMGQEYDIESVSYDPAISARQIIDNARGKFSGNTSKQTIFRPKGDIVSINSYANSIMKNFDVQHVNNTTKKLGTLVDFHDPAVFHPTPIGTNENGDVLVTRKTTSSSVQELAGTTLDSGVKVAGIGLGVTDLIFKIQNRNDKTAQNISTTGAIVGEVATAIDAPFYNAGESSANDTTYFMDRTGFTDYMKTDERKEQDEQEDFIKKVRKGVADQNNKPPTTSTKAKPKSKETWTDPSTGIVYQLAN